MNDSANRPTGTSSDVTFTAQQTISFGICASRSARRRPISENGSDVVYGIGSATGRPFSSERRLTPNALFRRSR